MTGVDWEAVRTRRVAAGDTGSPERGKNHRMHIRNRSIQLTSSGHREALIAKIERARREGRGVR